MFWTIFLILAVLKVMELITTSWAIIALFGIAGFTFKFIWATLKYLGDKNR